jgi:pyruvate dehydrogenase E1 component beta subunit
VPIGVAAIRRAGEDVTLVAWGGAVGRALAAAEALQADHGVSAEVLDLRTVSPLDEDAIVQSLAKTGRLVIVHDAVEKFGPGAEIAALASSKGFEFLRAPVERGAPFAPVPLNDRLEQAYYPQAQDIVDRVQALIGAAA